MAKRQITLDMFVCDIQTQVQNTVKRKKTRQVQSEDKKKKTKKYNCPDCEKSYTHKGDLNRHINRKHNPNFERYQCPHCEKSYTRKHTLNDHIESKHNQNFEGHQCPHCEKTYSDPSNLTKHIKVKHNPEFKGYKCEHCDFVCNQKQNLSTHVQRIHDIGKHKCQVCYQNRNSQILFQDMLMCRKCYNKSYNIATGKEKKELEWSNYIDENLGTEFLLSSDVSLKSLGGCTLKRPDKMYASDDIVEIDECDEHQHNKCNGDYTCDEQRLTEIYDDPSIRGKRMPITRWNPDAYKAPSGKKKYTRQERLELFVHFKNTLRKNYAKLDFRMKIFYMFYSQDNPRISQNIDHVFIYDKHDIDGLFV